MKIISGNIKSKQKGITLIALVVTIIVLLILAGITIATLTGQNGILGKAKEAKFKNKMSQIAEEWDLKLAEYKLEEQKSGTKRELTYAGEVLKSIIIEEELEIEEGQVQDIKTLIKSIGNKEEGYVIIHEDELYYVSQSSIPNNVKQTQWCEEIGIKIWEYTPSNSGIKVTNGSYQNVKGLYMCTPQINTGFVKEKTRYVKENNKEGKDNLVPGTWINKKPEEDWYDYKNKKWANLYVESSGIESYYVWIPRYAYKVAGGQQTDVKFVDINNNYIDGETEMPMSWEQLKADGYQVPEAFYWGDNDDYTKNTPIPGYWMSKYQLSELKDTDTYTIDFKAAASSKTISIREITVNTEGIAASGKTIAKYTYAVNGKIVHESTNGEDFKLTGLSKGDKAINVTILDENDEIIGSMTKLYEIADVNEPDLTGFDPDTTFYVYWDEDGIEHNDIPIKDREREPAEWYDYTAKNWANIVTRNNGVETYLVWIPRYAYALDTVSKMTYVKFIKGTEESPDPTYQVPEAFYWGDDASNYKNNKPISGYWMSKYQLSDKEATAKMAVEMSAGSNEIRLKDITGSITEGNVKYEYYIDGKQVHDGTNAKERYVYEGLQPKTTYTINIIARNADTKEYLGAVTQKVTTIVINKPDLTGFNIKETDESGKKLPVAYYVEYDENGENPKVGEKIQNDGSNAPKDWYDYPGQKWANIVVTDGTIENGQITGATKTTYLVWIPRYAYSLDTQNKKTNVEFLDGVDDEVPAGYAIPEAFYWGDNASDYKSNTPIKGFWMSKYQLSN